MLCKDKVAIVTGATGNGIGRSIALTLAREGGNVVVNYKNDTEKAEKIVNYIKNSGGNAIAYKADIFDMEDCRKLAETAISEFDKIDICILSPGGGWHPEPVDNLNILGALDDVRSEVAPVFNLLPCVLPDMYKRKDGRIIGITVHPTKLPPAYAYNVAKAARTQAMLLAQEQVWRNRVTINCIAPGPVTGINSLEEAIDQCNHGEMWLNRKNTSPQDIAEGVAFLCSESGRFITSGILPYDFY